MKKSSKSCNVLKWPVSPHGSNYKVCATSMVKPRTATKCSSPLTFLAARKLCSRLGGRVCSADELSQGVAVKSGCNLDSKRVWTSTVCPFDGQAMTQAGDPGLLSSLPKKCSRAQEKYHVRCCADFKEGEAFEIVSSTSNKQSIAVRLQWRAYTAVRVSYRKIDKLTGSSGLAKKIPRAPIKWVTPRKTRNVVLSNAGQALVQFFALTNSDYEVRVTPIHRASSRYLFAQSVFLKASTGSTN